MSFFTDQWCLLQENLNKISEGVNVSFEFFPPQTSKMNKIFWNSITKLANLKPFFISITHSVNSKNKNLTYETVKNIKDRIGLKTVPHLTCINNNLEELKEIATKYWKNGIHHVLALRGDKQNYNNHKLYCLDLIKMLKKIGNFDISVAAYPEIHPEAKSAKLDLINLKNKIDAGANRAITQFFFNVNKYLRFRDKCISLGINKKIIPGILPISNFYQLRNFLITTNVKIPNWIIKMLDGLKDDLKICKLIGESISIEMIKILINEGVKDFHFYTLNRFDFTYAMCHILGIRCVK